MSSPLVVDNINDGVHKMLKMHCSKDCCGRSYFKWTFVLMSDRLVHPANWHINVNSFPVCLLVKTVNCSVLIIPYCVCACGLNSLRRFGEHGFYNRIAKPNRL